MYSDFRFLWLCITTATSTTASGSRHSDRKVKLRYRWRADHLIISGLQSAGKHKLCFIFLLLTSGPQASFLVTVPCWLLHWVLQTIAVTCTRLGASPSTLESPNRMINFGKHANMYSIQLVWWSENFFSVAHLSVFPCRFWLWWKPDCVEVHLRIQGFTQYSSKYIIWPLNNRVDSKFPVTTTKKRC